MVVKESQYTRLSPRDGLKVIGAYFVGGLLAACTPRTHLPELTATAARATPEAKPTAKPTVKPTVSPTPTETGPKEGATKVENGVTYTYKKVQYGANPEDKIEGWFRSGIADGKFIYIIDKDQYGWDNLSLMSVNFIGSPQNPQKMVYLDHPTPTVPYDTNEKRNASFSGFFYNILAKRLGIPRSEWINFYSTFAQGTLKVPFTTPDGIVHSWKPSLGYKFYSVNWNDADPATHPEFHETHDRYDANPKSFAYRWAVTTDAAGNLVGIGAVPEDINTLTSDQIIRMVLAPLAQATAHETIPAQSNNNYYFDDSVEWLFRSAQGKLVDPAYFTIVKK